MLLEIEAEQGSSHQLDSLSDRVLDGLISQHGMCHVEWST